MIPAKYAIGQPVMSTLDALGVSLGIVYAKAWCDVPNTAYGGFWRYWVKQRDGAEYNDMEEFLSSVRLSMVYLTQNLKVIKGKAA